jgi:hypothetical protein
MASDKQNLTIRRQPGDGTESQNPRRPALMASTPTICTPRAYRKFRPGRRSSIAISASWRWRARASKKDELLHGPCVLDIAPTVLTMFGLPVGDLDGRWPPGHRTHGDPGEAELNRHTTAAPQQNNRLRQEEAQMCQIYHHRMIDKVYYPAFADQRFKSAVKSALWEPLRT